MPHKQAKLHEIVAWSYLYGLLLRDPSAKAALQTVQADHRVLTWYNALHKQAIYADGIKYFEATFLPLLKVHIFFFCPLYPHSTCAVV